jgi:hypothetical protein
MNEELREKGLDETLAGIFMSDPPSTIPDPIQASGGVVAWGDCGCLAAR